ncbi:MAG: hypothetical protein M5R36_26505 [Deltaproteobacteria bacterium]|nr:hypothetical protein [Deltaproteobacteria bacterium]
MSFQNRAFLLPRQGAEHLPQIPSQLSKEPLATILGNENHVVLALPYAMAQAFEVVHMNSFVRDALVGSRTGVHRTTSGTVKRRMPPRQSRGNSPWIRIAHNLEFLFDVGIDPDKAKFLETTFSDEEQKRFKEEPLFREQWKNRLTSDLHEFTSVLHNVFDQALSVVPPILQNSCSLPAHSLLGIGNSYKAMLSVHDFIFKAFEEDSIRELFREEYLNNRYSFRICTDTTRWTSPDRKGWLETWQKLSPNPIDEFKPIRKPIYLSETTGFRESPHSIVVAMQVLRAAETVRWSPIVNTHEFLHSRVRELLAVLFSEYTEQPERFDKLIEENVDWIQNEKSMKTNLPGFLRSIFIYYLSRRKATASFRNDFRTACEAIGHGRVNVIPLAKNKFKERNRKIDNFSLRRDLAEDGNDAISELLVHTLDFLYFYDMNPLVYIPALWLSWKTVPSVLETIDDYLLRTVSALAVRSQKTSFKDRFSEAVDVALNGLNLAVNAETDGDLASWAVEILNTKEALDLMLPCFHANMVIVDAADVFLFSNIVSSSLNKGSSEPTERISDYPGRYFEGGLRNPIALIKKRLHVAIDNAAKEPSPRAGTQSRLDEARASMWLLQACASTLNQGKELL